MLALVSNELCFSHVQVPHLFLSAPFHLVSVQMQSDVSSHPAVPQASLDTSLLLAPPDVCRSGFDIQPLHCYFSVRPLQHSLGVVFINPWPMRGAFKISLCDLKCCLIFGFSKLLWSILVAITFFWKSVGF